ncbi:MAG: hypothetical protein ACJ8CR_20435 [Roseiflexaceae bacterium]
MSGFFIVHRSPVLGSRFSVLMLKFVAEATHPVTDLHDAIVLWQVVEPLPDRYLGRPHPNPQRRAALVRHWRSLGNSLLPRFEIHQQARELLELLPIERPCDHGRRTGAPHAFPPLVRAGSRDNDRQPTPQAVHIVVGDRKISRRSVSRRNGAQCTFNAGLR